MEPLPQTISENTIMASMDFVDVCCQQTAFIAGRHLIDEELEHMRNILTNDDDECQVNVKTPVSVETFCLTLPGQELHLPSLLHAKKFRNRGNKDGALTAFRKLAEEKLGNLTGNNPHYIFRKEPVLTNKDEKIKFASTLMKYNVSISDYITSFDKTPIKMNIKRSGGKVDEEKEVKAARTDE
jgi:hypothetical protein